MEIVRRWFNPKEQPSPHRVVLQPLYVVNTDHRCLPAIEQQALDFYRKQHRPTNILFIDSTLLPAFGFDHYDKWFGITGNYFDAYMQHGKTHLDGEDHPFSDDELVEIRRNAQEYLEMGKFDNPEQAYEVFKNGSLFMLDRLRLQVPNFRMVPERAQPLGLLKAGKRMDQALERFNVDLGPEEDISDEAFERIVTNFAREMEKVLKPLGKSVVDGDKQYRKYLEGFISDCRKKDPEVAIFAPRSFDNYLINHRLVADLAQRSRLFVCLDATFSEPDFKPSFRDLALTKFIQNPNATLTRDEAIVQLAALTFTSVYDDNSLSLRYVADVRDQIPQVIAQTSITELTRLLRESTQVEILDYIGQNTDGQLLGTELKKREDQMREMIDLMRKHFPDGLLKRHDQD